MNFKVLTYALVCVGTLACSAIQAKGSENSGKMHVQISNNTLSACRLTDQSLLHGIFVSAPPQSIMVGDSKIFDMDQSIVGPDAILAYTCDDKNVRFEIQQDLTIFSGHEPKLTIIENNGIVLQSTSQSSSVLWDSPGMLNISISS